MTRLRTATHRTSRSALNMPAFEKPPLECYKSILRHALNFAYTRQTTGPAGKGFPVRGLVAFPFWTRSHPPTRLTQALYACISAWWREEIPVNAAAFANSWCANFQQEHATHSCEYC